MKNLLGQSIANKLIFLFVLTSISTIGLISFVSYIATTNAIRNHIEERLSGIAEERMRYVKDIWQLRVHQAQFLAEDEDIPLLLDSHNGTTENAETLQAVLIEHIREVDLPIVMKERDSVAGFYDIRVITNDGKIVFNSNELGKIDISTDVPVPLLGGYSLKFDENRGEPALLVTVPVRHKGEVMGVIVATRDISVARNALIDRQNLGDTGETYLVNKDRVMVTDSRFVEDAPFRQVVNTLPVKECFGNGKDMHGEIYPDYRGVPVFGSSKCDTEGGLVMLAEADEAEILAPIRDLEKSLVLTAIGVVAVTGILAVVFSETILEPIRRLTRLSKRIGEGDLEVSAHEIGRQDEVGLMEKTMVEMARSLSNRLQEIQNLNIELTDANNQLRNLDRLKTEFISVASHELKSPIQPILGYIDMAADGSITPQQAVDGIQRHVERLRRLANNILDVSRIESGNLSYNMRRSSINELLAGIVDAARITTSSKEVSFETSFDTDVELMSDDNRLEQAFSNILGNAVKFTEKGSIRVETAVSREKGLIKIIISDTGRGLSQDIQSHLFEKFITKDESGLNRHGSGLGLYISKAIIEAHRGTITAHNNEGGGATFEITLPILGIVKKDQMTQTNETRKSVPS